MIIAYASSSKDKHHQAYYGGKLHQEMNGLMTVTFQRYKCDAWCLLRNLQIIFAFEKSWQG